MRIVRRTFEASKHPVGSPERSRLNCDPITSEYMPSFRYLIVDIVSVGQYRTKAQAEAALAANSKAVS